MRAYALTDPGKVRKINQDYIFLSRKPVGALENLFLLADGMGGERAGDFASRYAVEHVVEELKQMEGEEPSRLLQKSIAQVNRNLYQEAARQADLQGTGTTLVAACIQGNLLYVANVGDSRLYLIRDNMDQITRDHSFVEEMVAMGKMQRGSRDYQTKKNIITRAVGASAGIDVDLFIKKLMPGDLVLLCSDGLTNMVDEMEIEYIIRAEGELKSKAAALIEAANRNGGKDNISVVLVQPRFDDSTHSHSQPEEWEEVAASPRQCPLPAVSQKEAENPPCSVLRKEGEVGTC